MSKYDSLNKDPYSVHQKILSYIGENKKILDVGCSEGLLAERLKINNSKIIGIELDKSAAESAEKYCDEVIVGDVESIELTREYERKFDIIIFADILEHLKEPLNVLIKFKEYLDDSGSIIISLPNVANWRMRFKLLSGNFDYTEYGILDNSHLRFFNEKNAKKLIEDAGLEIHSFDISVGDVKRFPKLFHSIGTILPNLFAFQFFIVAKKKK